MAEITRETLELAALAAGHEVACTEAAFHGTDDPVKLYGGGLLLCGMQDPWRPNRGAETPRRWRICRAA